MTDGAALQTALQASLELGQEILALLEREHLALRDPAQGSSSAFEFFQARLRLMPRVEEALHRLRQHRRTWQQLTPQQRQALPQLAALLRANQELLLRILVLDRENQQLRLRHGVLAASGGLNLTSAPRPRHSFSALA